MVRAKKQAEYHWDKGDVSWSFPGTSTKQGKKEADLEKVIKTKKTQKQTIDDILNSINQ
tara:strand:- start:75 stop:251 length:177 start_codon:yes stop_codon:yes gene_type:complete